MKLQVVSKDAAVEASIREALAARPNIQVFSARGEANYQGYSDIYIWDFEPGDAVPQIEPLEARKHLFLVKRSQLPQFREAVTVPGVGILLKPVARPILEAFLEHASERRTSTDPRDGGRDQILQSLIQANLKLQEHEQDRANFLARAVHDFRAPLTAFSGYCGLLLGGQLGSLEPEQRDVLVRMEQSAKRLSRMATAMFQLNAGGSTDQNVSLRPGDLRQAVEQALEEVSPITDEKAIDVSFDWQAPPESLSFDRSQMEHVLVSLMENACKFAPKFGSMEVKGYPCSTAIAGAAGKQGSHPDSGASSFRIDIRDSGPAIPAHSLDRIFEEYASYAGGQDRSVGGLGLAICKSIVARHHGRIWAENSPHGTLFSFTLPIGTEGREGQFSRTGAEQRAIVMEA